MSDRTDHDVAVEDAVRQAIARFCNVSPDSLTADASLAELGIDDQSAGGLLLAVEDVLEVRFPDDFLDGLHTYGDLTNAVRVATTR